MTTREKKRKYGAVRATGKDIVEAVREKRRGEDGGRSQG